MKVLFFNGLFKLHFIEPTLQDVFCLQSVSGQLFSAVVFTKTPSYVQCVSSLYPVMKSTKKKSIFGITVGGGAGWTGGG